MAVDSAILRALWGSRCGHKAVTVGGQTRYCAEMPRFLHAVAIWLLILGVAWVSIAVPHRSDPEIMAVDSEQAADSVVPEAEQVASMTQLRGRMLVFEQSIRGASAGKSVQDLTLGDTPLDHLSSAIVLCNFGMKAEAAEQIDLAAKGFARDNGSAVGATNEQVAHEASDEALLNAISAVVNAWPTTNSQVNVVPGASANDANGAMAKANLPTEEQFELLRQRLGWFGELAQAKISDDQDALSTMQENDMVLISVFGVVFIWYFGFGACGIAALITLIVMGFRRTIGSAIQSQANTSLILGETFVAWFVLFLGLQFVAMMVPIDSESPLRLALSGALMFAGLGALAWARVRGLSISAILDLTGLRWNQGFFQLIWKSAISYTTALPLLGVGLLIGLGMGWFFDVPNLGNPSHPIQQLIQEASYLELILLFSLACVAAPITEEIMFRGVLYGHLRQGTSAWGVAGSMIFSMVISGVLFGVIHPQGVFIAPVLGGLACGFCITREWSGSVFPGMIAHGIQNATALLLNVVLFQM